MPWHDIHCCINGPAASDVAHNFVSKWNHHRAEEKNKALMPMAVWPGPFCGKWQFPGGFEGAKVQVVRSLGGWAGSPGQSTEHSIKNAYQKLIKESKHYIYIENQVWITYERERERVVVGPRISVLVLTFSSLPPSSSSSFFSSSSSSSFFISFLFFFFFLSSFFLSL